MTDEATEVDDLLKAIKARTMTLDEVAQRFRERDWPATSPPPPQSYAEMAAQAMEDPEPDVPGSFDEVVAAYDRGELSEYEYEVLSEAVAEAKRARNRPS